MKKILFLLLIIPGVSFAQQIPDYGFDKIRIAEGEKTIQAELKPVSSDPQFETDRLYYWYSGNSIHATQGGFSGRLLNGQYWEYYINKNLKEEGKFKKGLKNGSWRSWNDSGSIIALYTWSNGLKSGPFNLFDDHGNLKQSGRYAANLLEGEIKTYSENKAPVITTYHKGILTPNKTSTFWQRVNVFRKKDKPKVATVGKATDSKKQ